jgi:starch synthase
MGTQVKGRVLSVASEAVPLLKTGGLADVVGALPAALAGAGWQMRVLMPAYRPLRRHLAGMQVLWAEDDLFGGPGQVFGGVVAGLEVLLLEAPHLFDREGGPYSGPEGDHRDNPQRFAALSWAAAAIARDGLGDGWRPDILHVHDWQAGFAPAYLRFGAPCGVKCVITVHNIAFQGWAEADALAGLRLPQAAFTPELLEYYGGLSSLKAGLVTADAITTVSPTYATELMRPEFGLGLEGVIAARAAQVRGILNGVDTEVWSPEADPLIEPYGLRTLARKARNRAALCTEFGLEVPGPLAIVVSRLTDQKGIDLIPAVAPEFLAAGGGLAVLGSGDPALEQAMTDLATRYPGRVGVQIGYDEALSHRMFAGGDAVLVPSRFEPCGLTQLYGLRYGTIPVVAATGGLADTVITANPAAVAVGVATGLTFHPTDALAFGLALRQLLTLYADQAQWARMRRTAMKQPVGWEGSAEAYGALYAELLA